MHDLFEGVCKYEISGILYKMIIDLTFKIFFFRNFKQYN